MWLLSVIIVVAPIIYGMSSCGWSIQAFVTPSYSPPKIDFHVESSGLRFEDKQLLAIFKLTNLGEVRIVFDALNATVYGPDGEALAPAILYKPVVSQPNSTETLILKVGFDEAALRKLPSYFEGRERVDFEVKGVASIHVFASKVTAPLSTSFEVSLTDIIEMVG